LNSVDTEIVYNLLRINRTVDITAILAPGCTDHETPLLSLSIDPETQRRDRTSMLLKCNQLHTH